jgi:hypothetical protein
LSDRNQPRRRCESHKASLAKRSENNLMKPIVKRPFFAGGALLVALTAGGPVCGQVPPETPAPNPTTPQDGNTASREMSKAPARPAGTSRDRLFFTLPNFLTVENTRKVPPLTTGEKFKVTAQSSFDYMEFLWYGALAGIGQARDSQADYGQGVEGYAKRYGAHFADGTIENFTTQAILPSLLHQDPRYFQKGTGGFWHRTGYAVSRIVITRTDSGRSQVNYSEILGSGGAAAIATYSYYPQRNRDFANVASVWGTQVGYDALSLVVKEFWPDIRRKLRGPKKATPHP